MKVECARDQGPAVQGASTPRKAGAAALLAVVSLGAAAMSSSAGLIPAARAQSAASAPAADTPVASLTLNNFISVLRANGFTAERTEAMAPFNGAIRTHLTGYPTIPVQLLTLPCKGPGTPICYLGFMSVFPKAPKLTPDELGKLDALTLAHVFEQSDGASNILRIQYTYACKDLTDPKFVDMVLWYFTGAVRQVLNATAVITGSSASSATPDKAPNAADQAGRTSATFHVTMPFDTEVMTLHSTLLSHCPPDQWTTSCAKVATLDEVLRFLPTPITTQGRSKKEQAEMNLCNDETIEGWVRLLCENLQK